MPKTKSRKKKSETKMTKMDESSIANERLKRRKNMPETKNVKIDESSSTNQETPTTSHDTEEKNLMNTRSGDFKDIRPMPAFVDKTMMIKTLMNVNSRILLTAPRRFGKSVNLTMLKRFFEILPDKEAMSENRKLFNGTKIEECSDIMKDHCGKYPVILLDFKCSGSRVTSYNSVLEFLRDVVHKAFKRHSYLRSSDKLDKSEKEIVEEWCNKRTYESIAAIPRKIESGLEILAELLVTHFGQKVIVLVDEYDCVCSNSIIYIEDIEKDEKLSSGRAHCKAADEIKVIVSLCMGTISCLLKGNDNVIRGVLTGISYFATMGLSALNNVNPYKFQEENVFSKFYGLTMEECRELLSRNAVSMVAKEDEIKQNYNGYRGEMLSIWSVMHFLNDRGEREDKNYWRHSGVVSHLDKTLKHPKMRSVINKLLSSISNEIEIDRLTKIEYKHIIVLSDTICAKNLDVFNVDVVLNFVLEQGYLKVVSEDVSRERIIVKIPNIEIKSEFKQTLKYFYKNDCNLEIIEVENCASLFDQLTSSDEVNGNLLKKISVSMNMIFSTITLNFQNEATLHHIIFFIILFCSNFKCFSELRVVEKKNSGKLDIMMLNCKSGMGIIIELKCKRSAKEGLEQIINKEYFDAFQNINYNPDGLKINYYLLLGLNVSEENKITLCALFNCETLEKCVNYD